MCLHQLLGQLRAYNGYVVFCRQCPLSVLITLKDIAEGRYSEIILETFGKPLTN